MLAHWIESNSLEQCRLAQDSTTAGGKNSEGFCPALFGDTPKSALETQRDTEVVKQFERP